MRIGQEEWTISKLFYAILIGGLLLGYLAIQAFDHDPFPFPVWLAMLRIAAAFMGIWLGKLWKDKGFLIILMLLLIQICRIIVKDSRLLFTGFASDSIFNGLWAIAGCYSLGRVFSPRQTKLFLRIIFASWTIGTVIQCLISLYGAFTDWGVTNLYGTSIWEGGSIWGIIWEERLTVGFLYPTVTGSYLSFSGVVVAYSMVVEEKRPVKILYGLALVVILFTLGLTDTRASYISVAAGLGTIAFALVLRAKRDKIPEKETNVAEQRKNRRTAWCLALVCMIGVFVISSLAIFNIAPVFNRIKTRGIYMVSVAKAEEETQKSQQVISRGVSGQDVLSGRAGVWKGTLQYILREPKRLLFGVSVYDPMNGPNKEMNTQMAHCHNVPLQIFLESGIIGLLIVLCFVFYTARNVLRIINKKGIPTWLQILPAFLVSIAVGDLMECFTWFRSWNSVALAFLFVVAGIINSYHDTYGVNT